MPVIVTDAETLDLETIENRIVAQIEVNVPGVTVEAMGDVAAMKNAMTQDRYLCVIHEEFTPDGETQLVSGIVQGGEAIWQLYAIGIDLRGPKEARRSYGLADGVYGFAWRAIAALLGYDPINDKFGEIGLGEVDYPIRLLSSQRFDDEDDAKFGMLVRFAHRAEISQGSALQPGDSGGPVIIGPPIGPIE